VVILLYDIFVAESGDWERVRVLESENRKDRRKD